MFKLGDLWTLQYLLIRVIKNSSLLNRFEPLVDDRQLHAGVIDVRRNKQELVVTLLLLHILDFQFQLVDPLLQDFLEPLDVLGGVVVGLADGHVERAF